MQTARFFPDSLFRHDSCVRRAGRRIALLAAVAAGLGGAAVRAAPLPTGPGEFTLANEGEPIKIYAYKPPTYDRGPLIVVIHGSDRDAENYRNNAITVAERCNAIIVAPLFDPERFPDERYKR